MPVVCNEYLLHYKITIEIVSLEPVMFAAALAFLEGLSPAPPPPHSQVCPHIVWHSCVFIGTRNKSICHKEGRRR
jgi:hypothetical protein